MGGRSKPPTPLRKLHFVTKIADRFSEPAGVALDAITLEPWNHQGPAADNANGLASRPRNSDPFMKNPG
jgi:hypothetical protein